MIYVDSLNVITSAKTLGPNKGQMPNISFSDAPFNAPHKPKDEVKYVTEEKNVFIASENLEKNLGKDGLLCSRDNE